MGSGYFKALRGPPGTSPCWRRASAAADRRPIHTGYKTLPKITGAAKELTAAVHGPETKGGSDR